MKLHVSISRMHEPNAMVFVSHDCSKHSFMIPRFPCPSNHKCGIFLKRTSSFLVLRFRRLRLSQLLLLTYLITWLRLITDTWWYFKIHRMLSKFSWYVLLVSFVCSIAGHQRSFTSWMILARSTENKQLTDMFTNQMNGRKFRAIYFARYTFH